MQKFWLSQKKINFFLKNFFNTLTARTLTTHTYITATLTTLKNGLYLRPACLFLSLWVVAIWVCFSRSKGLKLPHITNGSHRSHAVTPISNFCHQQPSPIPFTKCNFVRLIFWASNHPSYTRNKSC